MNDDYIHLLAKVIVVAALTGLVSAVVSYFG